MFWKTSRNRLLGKWECKSGNSCSASLKAGDRTRSITISFAWDRPPTLKERSYFFIDVLPLALESATMYAMRFAELESRNLELEAEGLIMRAGADNGSPGWLLTERGQHIWRNNEELFAHIRRSARLTNGEEVSKSSKTVGGNGATLPRQLARPFKARS